MVQFPLAMLLALRAFFLTRSDVALEIRALRQQVAVLKRKRPRALLHPGDRLFWTTLRRLWLRWADVLLIVKPRNCDRMAPRRLFPLLALEIPIRRRGRPRITQELRDLIDGVAKENPDWGAPKIHAELQKLGFSIAERSVARYLRRVVRRGDPDKKWRAFLQNHREVTRMEKKLDLLESNHGCGLNRLSMEKRSKTVVTQRYTVHS